MPANNNNITLLYHKTPQKYKYILDSNIWLFKLKPPISVTHLYNQFIENIIKINSELIICSAILSEVFNRYLRDVSMVKFAQKNNIDKDKINKTYFKEVYRSSDDFKNQYKLLCDEFNVYKQFIKPYHDNLTDKFLWDDLLSENGARMDMNDIIISNLAKAHDAILVTHDLDHYHNTGIKIYTYNKSLFDRQF